MLEVKTEEATRVEKWRQELRRGRQKMFWERKNFFGRQLQEAADAANLPRVNGRLPCGTLHTLLPPYQGDTIRVEQVTRTKEQVRREKMMALIQHNHALHRNNFAGTFTVLHHKHAVYGWEIMMSDTGMEWETNQELMHQARGRVLIGGLGLGMLLLEVQQLKQVTEIVVIEYSAELIAYIKQHLPLGPKITILEGDVFEPPLAEKERFDTVYMDIWASIGGANYPGMRELRRVYRRFRKPGSWLGHWMERTCKARYRDSPEDYDEEYKQAKKNIDRR